MDYFEKMEKEDFEKAFGILMRDTGLIYGNMARDLYASRNVLTSKYRLLSLSYNVFIFGLILTVVSFLINLLFIL